MSLPKLGSRPEMFISAGSIRALGGPKQCSASRHSSSSISPIPRMISFITATPLPSSTYPQQNLQRTICPRKPTRFWRATTATPRTVPDPSEKFTATPPRRTGTIIVPGKFDAFHLGHRELARVASTLGSPTLLSFSGMAEALKWPPRAPVVAALDRDRILRSWSAAIGANISYRALPFPNIRSQTPNEFLDMLVTKFRVKGIVCGQDWRFGHRASGDVDLLKKLAAEKGIQVKIVDGVDLEDGEGAISSTRVRAALASGEVETAAKMLGRNHRLVGYVASLGEQHVNCDRFVNQVPGDGTYECVVRVIGRAEPFRAEVRVERPRESDRMTSSQSSGDADDVMVRIAEAEVIYCEDCEVYLDFVERIG